ncbi:hypothetical protein HUN41_00117 [Streptomyces phage Coruscant]|uniref:Uncharacterized protein n=1 Tax=Streptomyces phage Coruscant TaxID=2739834 RepID=A0A7G4AW48_9CAUD|nr:hypothetical protein PP454_gp179 [Streptomyces phage Coruscant]QMP84238.1 hypothetical protein HUN41_00117 [Streptomyces phage Coruscant]
MENKCERCGDTEQLVYMYLEHKYCYDCCTYRQSATNPRRIESFEAFKREEFKEGDLVKLWPDMVFGTFFSEGVKVHHILVCGEVRQINKKVVYRREV